MFDKKAYQRKYYEFHKEKLLAYQKKYAAEHQESIREYNRARRPNKDKIATYHKNYYEQHKAEFSEKIRQYRMEHKEEISARRKEQRASQTEREKDRRNSYKRFYGKNPKRLFCKYINNGFYRYISSFRNYLLIAKSENMISYMTRLGLGTILEEDVIMEIGSSEIVWTEEDEAIYLDTIRNTSPSGILPEHLSFYKQARMYLCKDDDNIASLLQQSAVIKPESNGEKTQTKQ